MNMLPSMCSTIYVLAALTPFISVGAAASIPAFLSGTHTGDGTIYSPGLGACGVTTSDTDFVVAADHIIFDEFPGYDGVNPNTNPICGLTITANYEGKSVVATIVDRCSACNLWDLALSPVTFSALAPLDDGRIQDIQWTFN